MTNPPGAMPPLPEPVAHINLNGVVHEVGYYWLPTETLELLHTAEQLQAYAAPLIERVAELEAERDRIERNRDMWKGQCERQAEQLTAMRKSLTFFVSHPGVWQLCSPDSEVMREAKASIDAAIAAKD